MILNKVILRVKIEQVCIQLLKLAPAKARNRTQGKMGTGWSLGARIALDKF